MRILAVVALMIGATALSIAPSVRADARAISAGRAIRDRRAACRKSDARNQ